MCGLDDLGRGGLRAQDVGELHGRQRAIEIEALQLVAGVLAQEVLNSTQYMDADTTRVTAEVGHSVHPTTHLIGRVAVGRGSANFRDDRPNPANSVNRALVDDSVRIVSQ